MKSVFAGGLLLLSACASQASGRVGVSPTVEVTEFEEETAPPPPPEVPESVVLDAAGPYYGYAVHDERRLSAEELLTTLASYDAVCLGEQHDRPEDHFAQLEVIRGFGERQQMRGFAFGVGFEMVRQEFDSVLRKYQLAEIDRDAFLEASRWEKEWGFSIHYYDPLFRAATEADAPLLALGVDRDLTRRVAREGIEGLAEDDAARLPELDLEDREHRRLFETLMSGHPGAPTASLDRFYAAQVIWDESMAELSARFLLERRPLAKLLIAAGVAHCHRSAIVSRLERRTTMQITNLMVARGQPVTQSEGPEAALARGYDYQLVFER